MTKIAVVTDLHANREAVEAVFAHARAQGATEWAFLGDFVGYGADPDACVELAFGHGVPTRGEVVPADRRVVRFTAQKDGVLELGTDLGQPG